MEFKIGKVKEGAKITGTVYKVTNNEVTLDINYTTEGTIYKNELTKKPIDSCKEMVKEGDTLDVIVKKVDDEKGIVLLSRIEIEEKEAFDLLQQYFNDEVAFDAKVINANKGGLILSALGFERIFMPMAEIDVTFIDNPEKYIGKTLSVKVIEIKRNKVVVSHKIVAKDALKEEKKKELETINVGDVLEGEVSQIKPYGAFVRFGQVEGLLHISEISHHNIKDVNDVLNIGDKVTVKVIEAKNNKRSLSMKALEETPWEAFAKNHKPGETVTGKVVKKMQFGMLVEVEKDVVGMINRYDYSWDPRYNLAGEVEVGSELTLRILNIDVKAKKMTLSKKHLEYNPWEDINVKVGETVSGQVKSFQSNGAIVEVFGVEAFLPIGEVVEKRIGSVEEVLKTDDVIKAIVKKFDKRQWQMVISKKAYDEKQLRDEFNKYGKESKEDQSQTLGELFAEKLKSFK
ncbi:MAG: S1 RNA-binding domain-containing protein [Candidatus Izemoplasmataceae bacterium]